MVTPNGDGINERVRISGTLVQLQQPVQLTVRVFSLGGQRVRTLFAGARGSGSFVWEWDGRDDSGNPVPVGIYLAEVDCATPSASASRASGCSGRCLLKKERLCSAFAHTKRSSYSRV